MNPSSQIVEGYQPIMPTFKGQVTEEQLNALVAYIKSLGGTGTGATTTGTTTQSTSPAANTLTPPRADRGAENNPGSNPNAPTNTSEVTNRENR